MKTLIIATRGSKLALWQATWVAHQVKTLAPEVDLKVQTFVTQGDAIPDRPLSEIGGKGVFTHEIEAALQQGRIQMAVHSLKDLPAELPPGLIIGATPKREDARDVLISRSGQSLAELPAGSAIGTSSLRRSSQILAFRPDLRPLDLRGNVDTRLRRLYAGPYDAIILAAAGLSRLGLAVRATEYLAMDVMLPAPGQGALAVEARADDTETLSVLTRLDHTATRAATTAERALLAALGGGCHLPIAAYGEVDPTRGILHLRGLVATPDGSRVVRGEIAGSPEHAALLGAELAAQLLARGAKEIIQP
ncbi:MAG: hydroxymethylbilane synthase [Anaerolineae bacterium]